MTNRLNLIDAPDVVEVGTSVLRVWGGTDWDEDTPHIPGKTGEGPDVTINIGNCDTGGGVLFLALGVKNETIASQVSSTSFIWRLEFGDSQSIYVGPNADLYVIASQANTGARIAVYEAVV